jgi:hypothetical protein
MTASKAISIFGAQRYFGVAQRFSAAIEAAFPLTALAAEGAIANQGALEA